MKPNRSIEGTSNIWLRQLSAALMSNVMRCLRNAAAFSTRRNPLVLLEFVCPGLRGLLFGGVPWVQIRTSSTSTGFEVTSKRRKGFPSETQVKRGDRVVRGSKELLEKLGRNDPCPCGSGLRFQTLLHAQRRVRWLGSRSLLLGNDCPA